MACKPSQASQAKPSQQAWLVSDQPRWGYSVTTRSWVGPTQANNNNRNTRVGSLCADAVKECVQVVVADLLEHGDYPIGCVSDNASAMLKAVREATEPVEEEQTDRQFGRLDANGDRTASHRRVLDWSIVLGGPTRTS